MTTQDDQGLSRAGWRKSTYSGNGNCIEIGHRPPRAIAVRDSADPHGPALAFTPDQWTAFTRAVKE
jgi:hypothetical protein